MTIYNHPDNYTGYVYLWYDTKAKFFYLGGHYGKVEDSYICSNKAMKRAYKLRPETFRFRVLEYVFGNTKELRFVEQKWLNRIKDTELLLSENVKNGTAKYYNVKKHACGGNGVGTNKGKSHPAWNKGMKFVGNWNSGLSGVQNYNSPERSKKLSDAMKKRWGTFDNPKIQETKVCPTCNKLHANKIYCSKQCCVPWNSPKRVAGLFDTVPAGPQT